MFADASAAMDELSSKMGSAGEQAAGLQQSLDQSLSGIQGEGILALVTLRLFLHQL